MLLGTRAEMAGKAPNWGYEPHPPPQGPGHPPRGGLGPGPAPGGLVAAHAALRGALCHREGLPGKVAPGDPAQHPSVAPPGLALAPAGLRHELPRPRAGTAEDPGARAHPLQAVLASNPFCFNLLRLVVLTQDRFSYRCNYQAKTLVGTTLMTDIS